MKDFLNRLKSPVVIAQLISILGAVVVAIYPEFNETIKEIVYSLTVIINCIAGLNNPTTREHF